jgi:tetratricopeptide (TPR) repeat protein
VDVHDAKAAIHDLDAAVTLQTHPFPHELLVARARALSKAGRKDEALCDCNAAIELQSSYPVAYYTRASIFDSLGRHKEELQDRRKLIVLKPLDIRNVLCYAVALSKASISDPEELNRCLDLLNGVIVKHGHTANGTQNLKLISRRMQILIALDRLKEALVDADLLARVQFNPYVEFERGAILQKLGQSEAALACYEKVFASRVGSRRSKLNGDTHYNCGLIQLRRLYPKNQDPYFLKKAIHSFQEAIASYTADSTPGEDKAAAEKQLGKAKAALHLSTTSASARSPSPRLKKEDANCVRASLSSSSSSLSSSSSSFSRRRSKSRSYSPHRRVSADDTRGRRSVDRLDRRYDRSPSRERFRRPDSRRSSPNRAFRHGRSPSPCKPSSSPYHSKHYDSTVSTKLGARPSSSSSSWSTLMSKQTKTVAGQPILSVGRSFASSPSTSSNSAPVPLPILSTMSSNTSMTPKSLGTTSTLSDPVAITPALPKPVATIPVLPKPVATTPAPSKPVATTPAPSKPVASTPIAGAITDGVDIEANRKRITQYLESQPPVDKHPSLWSLMEVSAWLSLAGGQSLDPSGNAVVFYSTYGAAARDNGVNGALLCQMLATDGAESAASLFDTLGIKNGVHRAAIRMRFNERCTKQSTPVLSMSSTTASPSVFMPTTPSSASALSTITSNTLSTTASTSTK